MYDDYYDYPLGEDDFTDGEVAALAAIIIGGGALIIGAAVAGAIGIAKLAKHVMDNLD